MRTIGIIVEAVLVVMNAAVIAAVIWRWKK